MLKTKGKTTPFFQLKKLSVTLASPRTKFQEQVNILGRCVCFLCADSAKLWHNQITLTIYCWTPELRRTLSRPKGQGMVSWGCLCHTTTVMMDVEFQQCGWSQLPGPAKGTMGGVNLYAQHILVPRMLGQGAIRWRKCSKPPGRAEPARGENSTSSITIAPAWAGAWVSYPHTHCKCQGRLNFNKVYWLHFYQCSEARHKAHKSLHKALQAATWIIQWGSFVLQIPFLIFKTMLFLE